MFDSNKSAPFLPLRQVDAGLSFTKKELESSFVFDLRTEERIWYLVAESEEDMNRWVTSICLLCGFNPTDDGMLDIQLLDKWKMLHVLVLFCIWSGCLPAWAVVESVWKVGGGENMHKEKYYLLSLLSHNCGCHWLRPVQQYI